MRRTKMICTLGPSSNTPEKIAQLIDAGMDVARLNFSHGTHEQHKAVFNAIRDAAAKSHRNIAIMADLQGPKMRTGNLAGGNAVTLVPGATLVITVRDVPGDVACVSTTYKKLPEDVRAGDRILVADGTMELRVTGVSETDVTTQVVRGGLLGEHKGINLPGVKVSAPCLTEKDLADLAFALELGADCIALSFVRQASDVRDLKEQIQKLINDKPANCSAGILPAPVGSQAQQECRQDACATKPVIVAKIERPEALTAFDDILKETDVVMVARGDLGIESDLENIPQIQKSLIRECNQFGVPVITATQMLESMVTNELPTRAEVSDVANAIYDGTDAVMLSGETAAGKFPIEAARVMADIAAKADAALALEARDHLPLPGQLDGRRELNSHAIGEAVAHMSRELDNTLIACFTRSGYTARAIARHRPGKPILAFALTEATLRQCAMVWGVEAVSCVEITSIDEMFRTVDSIVLENKLAQPGDTIIIVAGAPFSARGQTNLLNLHTVGTAK